MSKRRPDSASWTAAKAHGDEAELAIAQWYKSRGADVTKTIGPDGYDLLIQFRLEVKCDLRAEKTGNVAIEVSYRGKPSGLMATRAEWFVVVVGQTAYMARTGKLRAFIGSGNFTAVPAGDGGHAEIVLLTLETLRALPFVQTRNLSEPAE